MRNAEKSASKKYEEDKVSSKIPTGIPALNYPDEKLNLDMGSMMNVEPAVSQVKEPKSLEHISEQEEQEEEEDEDDAENSFLNNVYLQKSPYIIRDSFIEQIEE